MKQNNLKEKYVRLYEDIQSIYGIYCILMSVLRYNDGSKNPTDVLPVADILEEKFYNLNISADKFLGELCEKTLI